MNLGRRFACRGQFSGSSNEFTLNTSLIELKNVPCRIDGMGPHAVGHGFRIPEIQLGRKFAPSTSCTKDLIGRRSKSFTGSKEVAGGRSGVGGR